MSVNNVRRHRTHEAEPADLAAKRTERVIALLSLRDHLAAAAAAYEAHSLDGALDLLNQQWEIERAIRSLAPRIYEGRWTEWLERDVALAHTPSTPHARCHICTMAGAA